MYKRITYYEQLDILKKVTGNHSYYRSKDHAIFYTIIRVFTSNHA